jgi:hypothetical protein
MPRFRVVVAAYARQAFEQEVFVDARTKEAAEDKAVDIASANRDWDPAGLPDFDGEIHIHLPVERVSSKVPLTRRRLGEEGHAQGLPWRHELLEKAD